MAREVVYKCDIPGCTSVRTPTNHWFAAQFSQSTNPYDRQYFNIMAFTDDIRDWGSLILLCGEACVHKFISQNLAALHPSTASKPEDTAASAAAESFRPMTESCLCNGIGCNHCCSRT